jgi:hypothetical protein
LLGFCHLGEESDADFRILNEQNSNEAILEKKADEPLFLPAAAHNVPRRLVVGLAACLIDSEVLIGQNVNFSFLFSHIDDALMFEGNRNFNGLDIEVRQSELLSLVSGFANHHEFIVSIEANDTFLVFEVVDCKVLSVESRYEADVAFGFGEVEDFVLEEDHLIDLFGLGEFGLESEGEEEEG